MNPMLNWKYVPALPQLRRQMVGTATIRLLITVLLATLAVAAALGQSRPQIQWMRGAIAGNVVQTALSPDGKNLATCGTDGTTKIRRLADGMLLETLVDANVSNSPPTVTTLAYTPDGTQIVTGSSASVIHVWNLASGTVLASQTTPSPVNSIALSPDGTKLAVGMTSNDILMWNLADFSPAGTFGGHTGSVNSVAFSPDGQKLASGSSDGSVRIWKVSDATSLEILPDAWAVTTLAFSPDNSTVCSSDYQGVIKIWNASTGTLLHSISGPTTNRGYNAALAISHDGTQLTSGYTGYDTKLHLWRISDAAPLATVDTTYNTVSVAYSSDGTDIYSIDAGSHIGTWSAVNLAPVATLPVPYTSGITRVAMSPTGTMIATTIGDGQVRLCDPTSGAPLTAIMPTSGANAATYINAFAFSPDGSNLAISGFSYSHGWYLWIYRISDGMQIRELTVTASSLAYTPDGTMLAVGVGNNINFYSLANMALIHTLTGHTNSVNAIAISPDGTTMASASSDRTIKTWSLSTYTVLTTLSKHSDIVTAVNFSQNSQEVIDVSNDGTSILWNIAAGSVLQTFIHPEAINTAVISPDGKQVTTGGTDRHLRIWNAASGSLLFDYTQETGAPLVNGWSGGVTSAVYSPDGKLIVYGRNDWTLAVAANPFFVPLVTGLTINPNSVVGGTSVTGTVTLNSTTLAGGAVISLSSDNTGVAAPALPTVTVPQGSATATFTINTGAVSASSTANITASLNGSSATAPVTVTTPTVLSLSVSPTSVRGGQNSTGTVTLNGPAPGGGLTVTLASNNSNAIAPANVKVAAGASFATFAIPTNVVAMQNTATISATLGTSATATLTITTPTVTALSTSPANLKGGQPSTGTVTISDPAPTGGILVTLASNNTAAASTVPSVTVAAGATTATFAITTHVVGAITSVTFTGSFNGSKQTTVLTVTPPTVSSVTFNPTSVKGGQNSTGTVTISDPAPASGVVVSLSSANSTVASVPASVTVASGSTTATFTVTTTPVSTDTPVVLTAAIGASNATGTLTVQAPLVAALAVNPLAVRSFQSAAVTITLDGPAPAGGIVVNLFSSNTAVAALPAMVTVAAGATTATAPVSTFYVPSDTTLLFAATLGTSNQSVHFTVQPSLALTTFYWRNDVSGQNNFWQLTGTTIVNLGQMQTVSDLTWKMVTATDLFHQGNTDLIWQNATGDVVYWDVKAGAVVSSGYIQTVPDHNWKIVGSADLFHKGNVDLIWENVSTGDVVYWDMNGATIAGSDYIKTVSDLNWQIFAIADLFHTGNTDLIWQNTATGDIVYWDLAGAAIASSGYISTLHDLNWRIAGSADLFGLSHTDLIWQNSSTGDVVYWDLTGSTLTGTGYIYTVPNLQWKIRAIR